MCFSKIGEAEDGRNILQNKGNYIRTIWDWFLLRWRVPVSVAEEMMREGLITKYVPVTFPDGETIALIRCDISKYGVYMDYA